MREYLFRGKRKDNGEWVEGSLVFVPDKKFMYGAYIMPELFVVERTDYESMMQGGFYEVYPATVGQYTGLVDKHGKRIFEGDVCRTDDGQVGEVKFVLEHCAFLGYTQNPPAYHCLESDGQMKATEVIGNIHDNPKLLEATT